MRTNQKPSDLINQAITNLMGVKGAEQLVKDLWSGMIQARTLELKQELAAGKDQNHKAPISFEIDKQFSFGCEIDKVVMHHTAKIDLGKVCNPSPKSDWPNMKGLIRVKITHGSHKNEWYNRLKGVRADCEQLLRGGTGPAIFKKGTHIIGSGNYELITDNLEYIMVEVMENDISLLTGFKTDAYKQGDILKISGNDIHQFHFFHPLIGPVLRKDCTIISASYND